MGRFNDENRQNPAVRFYEWDSKAKCLKYYDKNLVVEGKEKTGGNVFVPLPFRFIALEVLATIKGYNEKIGNGYYSNELKSFDTTKKPFIVKCGKNKVATGLYRDIIETKELQGAKFTKSVYCAVKGKEEGTFELANIQFNGCSLTPIVELEDKKQLYKGGIEIYDTVEGKKGTVTFNTPVMRIIPLSPVTENAMRPLDKELQEYLTAYFKRGQEETPELDEGEHNNRSQEDTGFASESNAAFPSPTDDLPF